MGCGSSKAYAPFVLWSRILVTGKMYPFSPNSDKAVIITFIKSMYFLARIEFLFCMFSPIWNQTKLSRIFLQSQRLWVWVTNSKATYLGAEGWDRCQETSRCLLEQMSLQESPTYLASANLEIKVIHRQHMWFIWRWVLELFFPVLNLGILQIQVISSF